MMTELEDWLAEAPGRQMKVTYFGGLYRVSLRRDRSTLSWMPAGVGASLSIAVAEALSREGK